MPAATLVSFPYAPGITTVLSPSGIAREHNAQTKTVCSKSINFEMPINTRGSITNLIIETAYIFKFVKVFVRLIFETVMPVRIIATGDIQFPDASTVELINVGSFILSKPTIIPISIATNMGFAKALSRWRMLCLPESAISRHGTAHR